MNGAFSWKKEDSQSVVRKLGGLLMGSVFSVPDPVASTGEIEIAYGTDTPDIRDIAQIKKDLPSLVQNGLIKANDCICFTCNFLNCVWICSNG